MNVAGMSAPAIEIRGLEKRFGPVIALKDVSFSAARGEVVGLVGVNGAGKSTLMNILDGVLPATSGEVRLAGTPVAFASPQEARAAGIGFIHQHSTAFDHLSVAENVCLQSRGAGWFGRARIEEVARAALDRLGAAHVDMGRPVGELPIGERQLVDVARVLLDDPAIVMFDEPTASLSRQEAERLFEVVAGLRGEGRTVFYTSHFLDDVLRLSDRVVVLRDGGVVLDAPVGDVTRERMVSAMLSRDLSAEAVDTAAGPAPARPVALEVEGLRPKGRPEMSLTVGRGEILGLWGLLGAGRTEVLRTLLGLDPGTVRAVRFSPDGTPREIGRGGLRRHSGFVTEDRHHDGLFLSRPIWENVTAGSLTRFTGPLWTMRRRAEREAAGEMVERLGIKIGTLDDPVSTLSGGNQQKVVLARWLLRAPDIYLFDEPTHGVDVGAKSQIHEVIHEVADRGACVIVVTSEVEEMFGLADRIVVLRDGEARAEIARADFDQSALLEMS